MSDKAVRFWLHRYLEDHSKKIVADIGSRKIVYLDLNYWIRLRKGAAGEDVKNKEIFDLVSQLYDSGKCIFPISEIVFWELLKQEDIQTRTATVRLVDRFSEGITIANTEHCMLMEVRYWMNGLTGKNPVPAVNTIWSKINTVMSYNFCQTIPDGFRESYLDFAANLSLDQVIADKPSHFRFKDNVVALNTAIKAHIHENRTAQDMFLSEVGGMIAEHAGRIAEASEYEYFKLTGIIAENTQCDETGLTFDKIMYHCFKTGKVTSQLPSLHIVASLHAWMRWTQKDFKDGNDTMDFMHATVALPYADYFLTERRLTAGIKAMSLDSTYNCSVYWQQEDVIACLKQLGLADTNGKG